MLEIIVLIRTCIKILIKLATPSTNVMLAAHLTVDEIKTIEIITNGLLYVDTYSN